MKLRTVDELVTRYRRAGDPWGWERSIVSRYLDEATAKAVIPAGALDEWRANRAPYTIDQVVDDAARYLAFSWQVALRHRNIESQRCAFKLDYWCWLLGTEPMSFAERPEPGLYRVGVFRAAAEFLTPDAEFPPREYREFLDSAPTPCAAADRQRLARMADGQPCVIGCPDGCLWKPPEAE